MPAHDDAKAAVDELMRVLADLQNTVNRLLSGLPIPAEFGQAIHDAWNNLVSSITTPLLEIGVRLLTPGDEDRIRATAGQWIDQVGGPVAERAGNATRENLTALDQWTGTAAEHYEATLIDQFRALSAVRDHYAVTIHDRLNEFATAVVDYWNLIRTAVVAATAAVIGGAIALAGATTGIGIALGIGAIAAAVAGFPIAVYNALESFKASADTVANALNSATEHIAFFETKWPAAVR